MLKNIIISCIALLVYTTVSAQDTYKPDKRLSEVFSQKDLSQMESSKSELIPYYNYYLDHSYYVVDLKKAAKKVTGTNIHTVNSRTNGTETSVLFSDTKYSKDTFNPLKYNFNLQSNYFVTYVWEDAGVAIVFYPLSQISNAFKKETGKTGTH
jgi:hypothetical protein